LLAKIWKESAGLIDQAQFDQEGRAVVDLRWVVGKGRILPLTTLETMIILKRDPEDEVVLSELDGAEALKLLEDNGYFNPHLLVRNDFKRQLRSGFFQARLRRTRVFQVNTVNTPEESQEIIRKLASSDA
jgi:hypothetical protein